MKTTCVFNVVSAVVAAIVAGGGVACANPSEEEEYLSFYISNHDQSPAHRVIHPIVGKTNFVYDAKGALERVRGEAIAFLVKDSKNVTIRNLRLDWERPSMTEATIVDIADGVGIKFLLLLIPIVGAVYHVLLNIRLARAFGKGLLYGLCLIFFTPLFILLLGLGGAKYRGPRGRNA